jgi:hypothetical protein
MELQRVPAAYINRAHTNKTNPRSASRRFADFVSEWIAEPDDYSSTIGNA